MTTGEREKLVRELYGDTHHITKVMGTEVNLRMLANNQSVCAGDMKTYYWLLTVKPAPQKEE